MVLNFWKTVNLHPKLFDLKEFTCGHSYIAMQQQAEAATQFEMS